jgi:heme A synthase
MQTPGKISEAPLFWLSCSTLALTAALVTLGGVVHNVGASLACPDWPLCFGQVLPPMQGNVAIEHSHRLLAAGIGILCIVLVFLTRKHPDNLLRKATWIALGLVVFQGLLGGVTVLLRLSPITSTAHLTTSQIFIAVLLWIVLRQRPLASKTTLATLPSEGNRRLNWAVGALLFQIALGAFIRHGGAAVACGLGTENIFLCENPATGERGLWSPFPEGMVHMMHRYVAIAVSGVLIWATIPILKWAKSKPEGLPLRRTAIAVHILLLSQIALGLWTVASGIGTIPVTLHLVGAMLLWLCVLALKYSALSTQQLSQQQSSKLSSMRGV